MENKQKIVPLPEAIIISKMDGIWARLLCFWSAFVVMLFLLIFCKEQEQYKPLTPTLAGCSTPLNSKLRVFSHFTVPNSLLLLWQCDQLSWVWVKEISLFIFLCPSVYHPTTSCYFTQAKMSQNSASFISISRLYLPKLSS